MPNGRIVRSPSQTNCFRWSLNLNLWEEILIFNNRQPLLYQTSLDDLENSGHFAKQDWPSILLYKNKPSWIYFGYQGFLIQVISGKLTVLLQYIIQKHYGSSALTVAWTHFEVNESQQKHLDFLGGVSNTFKVHWSGYYVSFVKEAN